MRIGVDAMSSYQSCANLKAQAKEHMFGHYKTAVGASLLIFLTMVFFQLTGPASLGNLDTVIGIVIYYGVSFLLSAMGGLFFSGIACFYLKIVCGQHVRVGDAFWGFHFFPDKALAIQAWISLIRYVFDLPRFLLYSRITAKSGTKALAVLILCTILSCFATVVLNLLYAQAFFLLHDFPQASAKELLVMSRRLMSGHKVRLLGLCISFLPLMSLSMLSCGIAMLWIMPYMYTTLAEFYLDLVKHPKPRQFSHKKNPE